MAIGAYSPFRNKGGVPNNPVVRVSNTGEAAGTANAPVTADSRLPETTNQTWADHAAYMKSLGNGATYMFADRALTAIGDALAVSALRGLPYEVRAEDSGSGSRALIRVVIEGSAEVLDKVMWSIRDQAAQVRQQRLDRTLADRAAEVPKDDWSAPIRDRVDQAPDMAGALQGFYERPGQKFVFSTDHGTLTEIELREVGKDNRWVGVKEAANRLGEQLRNVSVSIVGGDQLQVIKPEGDKLYDLPPTFYGYRVKQKTLAFERTQATMRDVQKHFIAAFKGVGLTITPPWLDGIQFEKEEGGSRLLIRPNYLGKPILEVSVPYDMAQSVKGLEIGQLIPETFTDSAGKTWKMEVTVLPKPYTPTNPWDLPLGGNWISNGL